MYLRQEEEEETPFVGYLHMHLTTVSHSQNKDTHNYYSLSKRRPNDVKAIKPANIRPGSHERTKKKSGFVKLKLKNGNCKWISRKRDEE
jgi:hypothetical protein